MERLDEAELYSGHAALMWAAYDETGWDHDYYKRAIENNGGLALDIGCGTGRLLRSYRRSGLNVEGVDISADMLAQCRRLAEAEDLHAELYCQPMQALDLPNKYDTIYIPCGSLACVMDRREALTALQRLKAHLAPGGELVFNLFVEDESKPAQTYPTDWFDWSTKTLPDGKTLFVDRRVTAVDGIEQTVREERRYRVTDGDSRELPALSEETRTGGFRWYTRNEALWLCELADLTVEKVTGDYTDEPFSAAHQGTMVFHCR
jgi:ubiquinone/menaquinone biosynthesis C-methylase UbiE